MNAGLKKEQKNENAIKYRGIKLVITKRKRNYLISEPNDQTTKFFT